MGIFDLLKNFVQGVLSGGSSLDDYGEDVDGDYQDGDYGDDLIGDVPHDEGYGGFYYDGNTDLEYIEDVAPERLIISLESPPPDYAELVTTMYDAASVIEYVMPAPETVLKIYAEVGESGDWIYSVFRFPSE